MKILVFQHVAFEYPGAIEDWAIEHNHELILCKSFAGDSVQKIDTYDVFIFLGGPMSVHDKNIYQWIEFEKSVITNAFNQNKKIIGICLGAQLIAETFGAEVIKQKSPEIGWHDVDFTWNIGDSRETPGIVTKLTEIFPNKMQAFHWHGETYNLPANSIKISESKACENQAFLIGSNVAAFQFHMEIKQEGVKALLENCSEDIDNSDYVQSNDEILNGVENISTMNNVFKRFLTEFSR